MLDCQERRPSVATPADSSPIARQRARSAGRCRTPDSASRAPEQRPREVPPPPDLHSTRATDAPTRVLDRPARKRSWRLSRAYSFIGGTLIGTSLSLPAALPEFAEGDAVLVGSLLLGLAGIGLHLVGARGEPRRATNLSSGHVQSSTVATVATGTAGAPRDPPSSRPAGRPQ